MENDIQKYKINQEKAKILLKNLQILVSNGKNQIFFLIFASRQNPCSAKTFFEKKQTGEEKIVLNSFDFKQRAKTACHWLLPFQLCPGSRGAGVKKTSSWNEKEPVSINNKKHQGKYGKTSFPPSGNYLPGFFPSCVEKNSA